jgi:hypothetical protein
MEINNFEGGKIFTTTTAKITMTKCNHEIGREAIYHDGITHPTGEQKCLTCNLTFNQILEEAREEGRLEERKHLDTERALIYREAREDLIKELKELNNA